MTDAAHDETTPPPHSRVPRGGWAMMTLILAAMALLSIYGNVQKARRHRIETVTIVRASPAPIASPSPADR